MSTAPERRKMDEVITAFMKSFVREMEKIGLEPEDKNVGTVIAAIMAVHYKALGGGRENRRRLIGDVIEQITKVDLETILGVEPE